MLFFPITTEAPGEKDVTSQEFLLHKTTSYKLPNLDDFVESKNYLEMPIYCLTPAFARINYYKYITKAIKTVVATLSSKNKLSIPKSSYRIFSNSQLPEKFLALLCDLATVGKNNLLIPQSGSSSLIVAGVLFNGGTITENGKPLPLLDEDKLLSPSLNLNKKMGSQCKKCTRCQKSCPANALTTTVSSEGYTLHQFQKEKCLQFLSHINGDYPQSAKGMATPFFYGCSLCQRACPRYQLTSDAINNRELALKMGTPTLPANLTAKDLLALPEVKALALLEERLKKSCLGQRWIDKEALLRNLKQLAPIAKKN